MKRSKKGVKKVGTKKISKCQILPPVNKRKTKQRRNQKVQTHEREPKEKRRGKGRERRN